MNKLEPPNQTSWLLTFPGFCKVAQLSLRQPIGSMQRGTFPIEGPALLERSTSVLRSLAAAASSVSTPSATLSCPPAQDGSKRLAKPSHGRSRLGNGKALTDERRCFSCFRHPSQPGSAVNIPLV
jgi:hypothetical protein